MHEYCLPPSRTRVFIAYPRSLGRLYANRPGSRAARERHRSVYVKSVYYASFGGPPWGVYSFALVGRPRGQTAEENARVPRVRDGCFAFRFSTTPPPLSFRFVFDRFYRFCAGPHTPGARCVSRRADLSSFPEYYHFFNVSRGRDRPVNAAARAAVRETRIHIYNVLPYYGVPLLNGAHGARTVSERPRNRAVRALERLWT